MGAKRLVSAKQGFTLVELVIVMAVIAVILGTVIPLLRGMQQEAQLTKSEAELDTIKSAVMSYWRNHGYVLPTNITTDLIGTTPQMLQGIMPDPFTTDSTTGTYGYVSGTDSNFGDYFAIYTKGPKGDTVPAWNASTGEFTYTGSGRVSSNAPAVKQ